MTKIIEASVIIPTYNEENYLPRCLDSLIKQTFRSFEIIIVDNCSTDKTVALVRNYQKKLKNLHLIKSSQKLIGAIRQAGFEKAKGEILISTDADTEFPPDWLSKIVEHFQKHPETVALGGPYTFYDENRWIRKARKLVTPFFLGIDWLLSGGKHHFAACNFAVRRAIFQKVGGFNTELGFGEDVELAIRLMKEGKIDFDYSLLITTSARRYQKGFLKGLVKEPLLSFFLYLKIIFLARLLWPLREKFLLFKRKIFRILLLLVILFFVATHYFSPFIFGASVHTNSKKVALTFDDGPHKKYTVQILKILKKYRIKATFFELGKNVEMYPEITRKVYATGNVIGNHSYSHFKIINPFDPRIPEEINHTQKIIEKTIGVKPRYFRPPYGIIFAWKHEAQNQGLVSVYWSNCPYDWKESSSEKLVQKIIKKIKPGDIILLHDGCERNFCSVHESTIKALPKIIERLKEEGYTFVTIDELINQPPYL